MKLFRNRLIKEWVWFNFLGWSLGVIIGPIFYILFISPAIGLFDPLRTVLMPIFLSFPFGVTIGTMQNSIIHQWKLPIHSWILTSVLSSVITTAFTVWFFHNGVMGIDIWAVFLVIMFAGFNIGVLQTILLRHLISKPFTWIVSYIGGIIAVVVMPIIISIFAWRASKVFINIFYSLNLIELILYRDEVLLIFNLITLPIWSALIIGLPTGNILYKSFSKMIENAKPTT